jgi:hypothetical protein
MIVAIIALVLAASGSAVAATSLVSGDRLIKKDSLSGNRLRARTITGRQIDLRKLGTVPGAEVARYAGVALHASTADNATNATTAASASTLGGVAASSFAPVLYVHVYANGTIDPSQAKSMGGVRIVLRKTSAYCFSGLPFTPGGGSATIDYGLATDNGGDSLAQLEIAPAGQKAADCQPGENVEVATSALPTGTFTAEPFYLVLYG